MSEKGEEDLDSRRFVRDLLTLGTRFRARDGRGAHVRVLGDAETIVELLHHDDEGNTGDEATVGGTREDRVQETQT